jgi:hypothetical protein
MIKHKIYDFIKKYVFSRYSIHQTYFIMGTIVRKGYTRKAHRRKAYTRKNGTRVKAAKVKKSRVPAGRIKDRGAPGKGPAVLPDLKKGDLGRYGYKVKDSKQNRERAIRKMVKKTRKDKALKNLRTLVVLRTYNKRSKHFGKINQDVKYAQKLYKERSAKSRR